MKLQETNSPTLEVAADFKLEFVPVMGAFIITFRSQLLDAEALTTGPIRQTTPVALTPAIARELHGMLGQALAAVASLGTGGSGTPSGDRPKH